MKDLIRSEDAVSETIGFILILAIIMISIGIIVAVGFPIIQQTRDNSQFQNMEQSFMVLQSSAKMVGLDNAPIKTVKMSLGDGTMTVLPNTATITISNGTGLVKACTVGSIVFEMKNRSIAYQGGGVWGRYYTGESGKISDPRISVSTIDGESHLLISIINITGPESSRGGGIAPVSLRYESTADTIILYDDTGLDVAVDGDYSAAWTRHIDETVDPAITYDTVVINEYVVNATVI
ncbi:MAG: hypothetical protein SVK08_07825 [Halobacteriota archaeon]|nr:hypothetical protein [Halobacteriota archaeon]